jgi:microcystin-dependent protein
MMQPIIGEIRMFAGNFAPAGWAFCNGQLLPISENDALFTLIGTTYGGDGQESFALPDLRSRVPIHQGTGPDGTNYVLGETGGVEQVTLTIQQIPVHNHALIATTQLGSVANPGGNILAQTPGAITPYIELDPEQNMNNNAVAPVGGSQPHTNLQPYLAVNYILSLFGIFPPPN